jgi:hypothetical protein
MLIELSGEQAAVIRDALQRARKESGFSDRASLFTYMARTFLEGGQDSGSSSKKPPYQVVIHHHPGAGVTWTETDKGSVYVPDAAFARVMCDTEIVELPAPPLDFAPGEPAPLRSVPGGQAGEEKAMTAQVRRDDDTGDGPAQPDSDESRESESPLEGVNRLYEIYRERARSEKGDKSERKTRKNPTGTIPPSLRKKVLLRDERRCKVPGCGRSHFVEVHHLMPQGACGAHVPEHLLVVCQFCHNLIHEGRLVIEGKAPGRLVFRRV